MSISKEEVGALRSAIDAALAPVIAKHGLASIKCGNATYDESAGRVTFKVEAIKSGGLSQHEAHYDMMRKWDKSLPGRGSQFIYGGEIYSVEGAKGRGRLNFLVRRASNGKVYKMAKEAFVRTPVLTPAEKGMLTEVPAPAFDATRNPDGSVLMVPKKNKG